MSRLLLDHRYVLAERLLETPYEQRYQAYHVELGVPVLVIAVRASVDGKTGDAQNFQSCATQSANLRHEALSHLRDYIYSGATHYAVFDAWAGMPVATYLTQAGRTLSEALIHALQLCDALDLVERQAPRLLPGVILSPQTLIVRDRWSICLREPEVARWLFPAILPEPSPSDCVYLAPEVRAGSSGDSRSLIYSISAFLYHALIGQPPSAEGRQLDEPTLAPIIPQALQSVISQGLERAPQRRFFSLDAFGIALSRAAYQVVPVSTRQNRRVKQRSSVQVSGAARPARPSPFLQEAR